MNWRCAAVSLLLAAPAAAEPRALTRGPYLVDATTTSAKVCWREGAGLDDYCQKVAGVPPGNGFKYRLPGLDVDFFGKTLPPAGEPSRFAVLGNLGDGAPAQERVARVLEAAEPQFVLLPGNIANPDGTQDDYAAHYFPVYRKLAALVVFFPAVGGDDYGNAWFAYRGRARFESGYAKVFQRPRYYSFDAGTVHFVSIDDNAAASVGGAAPLDDDSAQLKWLDDDLAASTADWKVVFLHVPPYSTRARHDGDAWLRARLQPVFAKRRVDLVFSGGDRVYQRSKKLQGTVYVNVGTGGAKLDEPGKGADWLEKEVVAHGVVVAEATRFEIHWSFFDDEGQEQDAGRVTKFWDPIK